MNYKNFFIKNKDEYNKIREMVSEIFKIESSLPNQVFSKKYEDFKFEQFDLVMRGDFWNTLKQLAIQTNDDNILLAVLDPKPEEYYYKEFNYYNWIKFPVDLSVNEYYEILQYGPENSPADAVYYNSFTIVMFSPSMKWAIWGERWSGICIIGFQDKTYSKKLLPLLSSWCSLDDTVISWLEVDEGISKDFVDVLYSNYSQNKK